MGLLMQAVEDRNLLLAGDFQQFVQVRNSVGLLETVAEDGVELAIGVEEVVVGVDQNDCGIFVDHFAVRVGRM